MVKNQIVTITIEDIGNDGEGIGKYEGYTLFVKGALPQDVVKVKVLKAKKTYGYAKVEELISPSPDRVTPKCPVTGRCGGCQLQHYSYARQLQYKADKVRNCLFRIGGIPEERLNMITEPVIGMEIPFYYRNKAQYPVGTDKEGNPVMGFYAGHSHHIIDCTDCAIQEPVNAMILPTIKQFVRERKISAYNEETGKGLLRHVLTRVGFHTKEVMVCLIINGRKFPGADELALRVAKVVEEFRKEPETGAGTYRLKSFCLNINTKKTNVILGQEILPVYGDNYITDYIGNIKYQISPLSFYQVNPKQTVKLYEKALEYAELSGNETVWDLYCGIGTISLFLAQKAKRVYGVEIVPQAIEDAKVNSRINNIANAEFFTGAAEDVMPAKYKESNGTMKADVICVDPPRKGCEESLLDTVVAMEPKRIVYVSCDPATLARDVKYLEEKGYELTKVCPVDQFGHTGHVETVAKLCKTDF
ncbi:MAG: 23S rRNA (uracil(1939)-C(5))-methyltransferase RlmD [Lachnospiraceae bacterium]|nr:23S rRNA (uracil(1939)-C(5))-methyltransferase RlmD [Lachnospiraceae bacterium]MBP3579045.1 23S rRNA (uracil(1939)-C(5))-methyltransferase RlmD [Lachnospiraceae bacterium]